MAKSMPIHNPYPETVLSHLPLLYGTSNQYQLPIPVLVSTSTSTEYIADRSTWQLERTTDGGWIKGNKGECGELEVWVEPSPSSHLSLLQPPSFLVPVTNKTLRICIPVVSGTTSHSDHHPILSSLQAGLWTALICSLHYITPTRAPSPLSKLPTKQSK